MSAAPDFSTQSRAQRASLSERVFFLVAAVGLVLATADAFRAAGARDRAYQELQRGRRDVDARRSRLRALELSANRGSTLRRQAELTALASPPWVISDLAALLPADARLDRVDLEYSDRLELKLGVEARSPAAYDRLLEALSSSGRLEGVVPGPEVREGPVDSSLKAVYRPREQP
jgi:hypothetical protein